MKVFLMHPIGASQELEFCDMGLGYLASGLRRAGHDARLLLSAVKKDNFYLMLRQEKPDILGIKVFTSDVNETIQTVRWVREVSNALIVIGGPHVSGDASRVLKYIPADYAFQGEADRSFPEFVTLLGEGANLQKIEALAGLILRKNGKIIMNPVDAIDDLDAISFPAWDLMPPGRYQSLVRKFSPAAGILTARGCTNLCSYCAESYKKLRYRSAENVLKEIKYLTAGFGVREIQFLDSNFIADRDYIKSLCHLILEDKLSLAFCAPNGSRLECVNEEVCALLSKVGFYRVNVGIESGSPEVLRVVRKGSDLSLVCEKIKLLRKYGIQVVGNFMLGFPGESREQMEKTLRLALSLDLTAANFSIYVPMPGTRLYNELVSQGKLEPVQDFRNYDFVSYRNRLSELSPDELKGFRNKCFFKFILRWRTFKTLYELHKSGILGKNLAERVYWMYISKFLKDNRR